jgi:hypothetical protein
MMISGQLDVDGQEFPTRPPKHRSASIRSAEMASANETGTEGGANPEVLQYQATHARRAEDEILGTLINTEWDTTDRELTFDPDGQWHQVPLPDPGQFAYCPQGRMVYVDGVHKPGGSAGTPATVFKTINGYCLRSKQPLRGASFDMRGRATVGIKVIRDIQVSSFSRAVRSLHRWRPSCVPCADALLHPERILGEDNRGPAVPGRLFPAYHDPNFNAEQTRALNAAAGLTDSEVLLVEGPPGTGKSRWLAVAIGQIASSHTSAIDLPVVIVAAQNVAVDNLLLAVDKHSGIEGGDTKYSPTRFGRWRVLRITAGPLTGRADKYDLESVLKREFGSFVKQRDKVDRMRDSQQKTSQKLELRKWYFEIVRSVVSQAIIVACTTNALPSLVAILQGGDSSQVICGATKLGPKPMATVGVIDEAAMVPDYSVHSLDKFAQRLLLAGDTKQLAPFTLAQRLPNQGRSREWEPVQSRMERLIQGGAKVHQFVDTYRLTPAVARWASQFYSHKLRSHNLQPWFHYRPDQPAEIWGIECRGEDEMDGTSVKNVSEIDAVVNTLQSISTVRATQTCDSLAPVQVAVITPYAAQRAGLIHAWTKVASRHREVAVEINTIDAFQGQEKDVVCISWVRPKSSPFIDEPRRRNVAMTRSRGQVIHIGARAQLIKYVSEGGTGEDSTRFQGKPKEGEGKPPRGVECRSAQLPPPIGTTLDSQLVSCPELDFQLEVEAARAGNRWKMKADCQVALAQAPDPDDEIAYPDPMIDQIMGGGGKARAKAKASPAPRGLDPATETEYHGIVDEHRRFCANLQNIQADRDRGGPRWSSKVEHFYAASVEGPTLARAAVADDLTYADARWTVGLICQLIGDVEGAEKVEGTLHEEGRPLPRLKTPPLTVDELDLSKLPTKSIKTMQHPEFERRALEIVLEQYVMLGLLDVFDPNKHPAIRIASNAMRAKRKGTKGGRPVFHYHNTINPMTKTSESFTYSTQSLLGPLEREDALGYCEGDAAHAYNCKQLATDLIPYTAIKTETLLYVTTCGLLGWSRLPPAWAQDTYPTFNSLAVSPLEGKVVSAIVRQLIAEDQPGELLPTSTVVRAICGPLEPDDALAETRAARDLLPTDDDGTLMKGAAQWLQERKVWIEGTRLARVIADTWLREKLPAFLRLAESWGRESQEPATHHPKQKRIAQLLRTLYTSAPAMRQFRDEIAQGHVPEFSEDERRAVTIGFEREIYQAMQVDDITHCILGVGDWILKEFSNAHARRALGIHEGARKKKIFREGTQSNGVPIVAGVRKVHKDSYEAIRNWSELKSPEDVRSFLGVVGYVAHTYAMCTNYFPAPDEISSYNQCICILRDRQTMTKAEYAKTADCPQAAAAFEYLKRHVGELETEAVPHSSLMRGDRELLLWVDGSSFGRGWTVVSIPVSEEAIAEHPPGICLSAVKIHDVVHRPWTTDCRPLLPFEQELIARDTYRREGDIKYRGYPRTCIGDHTNLHADYIRVLHRCSENSLINIVQCLGEWITDSPNLRWDNAAGTLQLGDGPSRIGSREAVGPIEQFRTLKHALADLLGQKAGRVLVLPAGGDVPATAAPAAAKNSETPAGGVDLDTAVVFPVNLTQRRLVREGGYRWVDHSARYLQPVVVPAAYREISEASVGSSTASSHRDRLDLDPDTSGNFGWWAGTTDGGRDEIGGEAIEAAIASRIDPECPVVGAPDPTDISIKSAYRLYREIVLRAHPFGGKKFDGRELTHLELLHLHRVSGCVSSSWLHDYIRMSRFFATRAAVEKAARDCPSCAGKEAKSRRQIVSFGLPCIDRFDVDSTFVDFQLASGYAGVVQDGESQARAIRVIVNGRGTISAVLREDETVNEQLLAYEKVVAMTAGRAVKPRLITVSDTADRPSIYEHDAEVEVVASPRDSPNSQPAVGVAQRVLKETIAKTYTQFPRAPAGSGQPELTDNERLQMAVSQINMLCKRIPAQYWTPSLAEDMLVFCRAQLVEWAVYEAACTEKIRRALRAYMNATTAPAMVPKNGALVLYTERDGRIAPGMVIGEMGDRNVVLRSRGHPIRVHHEKIAVKLTQHLLTQTDRRLLVKLKEATAWELPVQETMDAIGGEYSVSVARPGTEIRLNTRARLAVSAATKKMIQQATPSTRLASVVVTKDCGLVQLGSPERNGFPRLFQIRAHTSLQCFLLSGEASPTLVGQLIRLPAEGNDGVQKVAILWSDTEVHPHPVKYIWTRDARYDAAEFKFPMTPGMGAGPAMTTLDRERPADVPREDRVEAMNLDETSGELGRVLTSTEVPGPSATDLDWRQNQQTLPGWAADPTEGELDTGRASFGSDFPDDQPLERWFDILSQHAGRLRDNRSSWNALWPDLYAHDPTRGKWIMLGIKQDQVVVRVLVESGSGYEFGADPKDDKSAPKPRELTRPSSVFQWYSPGSVADVINVGLRYLQGQTRTTGRWLEGMDDPTVVFTQTGDCHDSPDLGTSAIGLLTPIPRRKSGGEVAVAAPGGYDTSPVATPRKRWDDNPMLDPRKTPPGRSRDRVEINRRMELEIAGRQFRRFGRPEVVDCTGWLEAQRRVEMLTSDKAGGIVVPVPEDAAVGPWPRFAVLDWQKGQDLMIRAGIQFVDNRPGNVDPHYLPTMWDTGAKGGTFMPEADNYEREILGDLARRTHSMCSAQAAQKFAACARVADIQEGMYLSGWTGGRDLDVTMALGAILFPDMSTDQFLLVVDEFTVLQQWDLADCQAMLGNTPCTQSQHGHDGYGRETVIQAMGCKLSTRIVPGDFVKGVELVGRAGAPCPVWDPLSARIRVKIPEGQAVVGVVGSSPSCPRPRWVDTGATMTYQFSVPRDEIVFIQVSKKDASRLTVTDGIFRTGPLPFRPDKNLKVDVTVTNVARLMKWPEAVGFVYYGRHAGSGSAIAESTAGNRCTAACTIFRDLQRRRPRSPPGDC